MPTLDFSGDFAVFDRTETVSLVTVTPAGVETTDDAVTALPEAILAEGVQDAGGVQMTPQTVTWHVRASTVSGKPNRGDRIVSTSAAYSGTYVIGKVDSAADATRYVCETQKAVDP